MSTWSLPPIHHNQVKDGGDGRQRILNPHYITFLESPPILALVLSLTSGPKLRSGDFGAATRLTTTGDNVIPASGQNEGEDGNADTSLHGSKMKQSGNKLLLLSTAALQTPGEKWSPQQSLNTRRGSGRYVLGLQSLLFFNELPFTPVRFHVGSPFCVKSRSFK